MIVQCLLVLDLTTIIVLLVCILLSGVSLLILLLRVGKLRVSVGCITINGVIILVSSKSLLIKIINLRRWHLLLTQR